MSEFYTSIETRGDIIQENATGILGCRQGLTHSDLEQKHSMMKG